MRYLIPAALALVIGLAAACGDDDNATSTPTAVQIASTTATATATSVATATTTATASPTPVNVCGTNPDPATPGDAVITAPVANDQVTSPLTVSGTIAAFEAVFQVSIKDANGTDIVTQSGMASEGQTLAPFSESVPFTVTAATPACVWVFVISQMDGTTPLNITQIPVTLVP